MTPWSTVKGGFDYPAAVYFPVTISGAAAPVAMPPVSNPTTPTARRHRRRRRAGPSCGCCSGTPIMAASAPTASTAPTASRRGRRAMKPDVITFNEIEQNTGWGHQDQPEVYKALLQQKTGRTWYLRVRAGIRPVDVEREGQPDHVHVSDKHRRALRVDAQRRPQHRAGGRSRSTAARSRSSTRTWIRTTRRCGWRRPPKSRPGPRRSPRTASSPAT